MLTQTTTLEYIVMETRTNKFQLEWSFIFSFLIANVHQRNNIFLVVTEQSDYLNVNNVACVVSRSLHFWKSFFFSMWLSTECYIFVYVVYYKNIQKKCLQTCEKFQERRWGTLHSVLKIYNGVEDKSITCPQVSNSYYVS